MRKLDTLLKSNPRVRQASEFAQNAHKSQRRKNGDPYYYHPLAVAYTLADWELDEATIVAGFLHGLHETGSVTDERLRADFGEEVLGLLQGVRDIRKITYQGASKDIETFRKFILQIGKDIRAMLIQLASRLDNLKLLYIQEPEVQRRVALETLEVHAPVAYRLGMYRLGGELEDLAFPYLYPKEYSWILKNLKDLYETRERYIEKLKGLVEASLKTHGLKPIEMHSRAKRYASLYKKLLKHDMKLDDIYDLVALRIIVNTVEECYQALEIINRYWPPFPEGFDDYIEHPKPNGYRSLHANIYGPGKRITEIQIRTKEMHYEAELGIAARFAYDRFKDTQGYTQGGVATTTKQDSWIRRLLAWRTNPKQSSAVNIFDSTMLVISPKQQLIEVPAGASALDYAFKIHSRLGTHAKEAIINGVTKPISTKLAFGDIVEIIEDETVWPKPEWLTFVVTTNTKAHIKSVLEKQKRSASATPQVAVDPTKKSLISLYHTEQTGILQAVLGLLKEFNINQEKTTVHTTGILSKAPTLTIITPEIAANVSDELSKKLACIAGITKATIKPYSLKVERVGGR